MCHYHSVIQLNLNGEIRIVGGSEEPKSTKKAKSLILEANGALRLHTKINVKVQELNVK